MKQESILVQLGVAREIVLEVASKTPIRAAGLRTTADVIYDASLILAAALDVIEAARQAPEFERFEASDGKPALRRTAWSTAIRNFGALRDGAKK